MFEYFLISFLIGIFILQVLFYILYGGRFRYKTLYNTELKFLDLAELKKLIKSLCLGSLGILVIYILSFWLVGYKELSSNSFVNFSLVIWILAFITTLFIQLLLLFKMKKKYTNLNFYNWYFSGMLYFLLIIPLQIFFCYLSIIAILY